MKSGTVSIRRLMTNSEEWNDDSMAGAESLSGFLCVRHKLSAKEPICLANEKKKRRLSPVEG